MATRRPSSVAWLATIRGRPPGPLPRRRSDWAPPSRQWASKRPDAPCGSSRETARAQLALSQALARTGDARGAFQAAGAAARLLAGLPEAREALADARWLNNDDATAFDEFRTLANELTGADRDRVVTKARTLYRQHAGWAGRLVAGLGPLFSLAFRRGWLHVA